MFKIHPLCLIVIVRGVRAFAMSWNAVYASLALSPAVSSHSCRPSFSGGTSQTGHLVGPSGENGLIPRRVPQLCSIPQLPHLTLLFPGQQVLATGGPHSTVTSLSVLTPHPKRR